MLLSVLIVGAVGLAISTAVILLGIGAGKSSLTLQQSNQAKALANACQEEALQKLRESIYYSGNQTISFTNGSCTIQTISGAGNTNRTIQTSGTIGNVQRKIKVIVATVHPAITIQSWQEVADF